jgi:hypothetical protein
MRTLSLSHGTQLRTRSDYRANMEAREIRRVRLMLIFQMKGRACGFTVGLFRQKPASKRIQKPFKLKFFSRYSFNRSCWIYRSIRS